jgi:hypothetical protein
MAANVYGVLSALVQSGAAGFDYSQRAAKPRDLLREIGEADQDVELTWHEIAGVRLNKTIQLTSDEQTRFEITLICLVTEPLRLLHNHFLKLANNAVDVSRPPPAFKLMNDKVSIVRHVCQYFASMLQCAVDRLALLWMLGGYSSTGP